MNRKVVVLQLLNRVFYKTAGTSINQYLGDPINILAHFSEYEANEILIMDISDRESPDFEFLKLLGRHCDMPLSYVGNVCTLKDIQTIINLGFERVLIGEGMYQDPTLIKNAVDYYGTSTIGVIVNYEFKDGKRFVWHKKNLSEHYQLTKNFLSHIASLLVGEIILYCISFDGKRNGFDFDVLSIIPNSVNVNICGGCKSIQQIDESLKLYPMISFSAGTAFSLLPNNSVFLKYDRDLL